jgi:hypothetical protein
LPAALGGGERGARSPLGWLLVFLAAVSALRTLYVWAGPYQLSGDEATYWDYIRHPQWCYYFKGPVVAWCIWAGTALLGNTHLGVRLPAIVLSAGTSLLLYVLGKRIYSAKVGAWAAALYQVTPLFAFYNLGMTIDPPYVLLWVLAMLLTHEACRGGEGVRGEQCGEGVPPLRPEGILPSVASSSSSSSASSFGIDRRSQETEEETRGRDAHATQGQDALATSQRPRLWMWLALGAVVGLGLMTKYTMVLYYPCALLYLAASAQRRRLLARPGPWIAVAVSLAFLAPLLWWDWHNGWVNLKHNLGHAEADKGLRIAPMFFLEFVGGELAAVTPFLLVMMLIALFATRKTDALSFWFSLPILAFFALKSLQGRVEANWPMAGYVAGFIAFAGVFIQGFASAGKHVKRLTRTAIAVAAAGTLLAHVPTALSLILSLAGVPPKYDRLLEFQGWSQAGREVSRLEANVSPRHFIITDRRKLTSLMAFYVEGNPHVFCIRKDPTSPTNDYDMWPGFEGLLGYDALYVAYQTDKPARIADHFAAAFDSVEERPFEVKDFRGRPIRKYAIFLCRNFKGLRAVKVDADGEE